MFLRVKFVYGRENGFINEGNVLVLGKIVSKECVILVIYL